MKSEATETPDRQASEPRLLKLFLQFIIDVRSTGARSALVEVVGEQLQITLFSGENGQQPKPLKTLAAPAAMMSSWLAFLLDRVYFWPDLGDELQTTNPGRVKRLLVAPASPTRFLADFAVTRKAVGSPNQIVFSNIQTEGINPIVQHMSLTPQNTQLLERMLKARTGIVLASANPKPHLLDGVSELLAMRPEACVIKNCNSERIAAEALALGESHLVIVGAVGDDPIEMIMNFFGFISGRTGLADIFAGRLIGSLISARVRRVCAACVRSTPVDPRTVDRVPIQLRPRVKNTYMFGRGCDACGHSAYRGFTELTSIVEADPALRELLKGPHSATELAQRAYKNGTRTLFEDGLEKIFSGMTSFEEVFSITSKISPAFTGAIATSEEGSPSGKIEAIDGDSFLANDALFAAPPKPAVPEGNGRSKVLIVEDDGDQRMVLESVFRTQGYDVYSVENGKVALDTLDRQAIDLIICDVMMPVMNGAQFVKELRSSSNHKHIPVLMLTAVTNPDAECALLSHGADDYCDKNVKRQVLLKRAEKLLVKKQKPGVKNPLEHMLKD